MGHAHIWSSIYIDLADHNVYSGSSRFATPHMLLVVVINRTFVVVSWTWGCHRREHAIAFQSGHHCMGGEAGSCRCSQSRI